MLFHFDPTRYPLMAKKAVPKFNFDVVTSKQASQILKESRRRGSRASKYQPIYDAVRDLKSGRFLVLRDIDKSSKQGLYLGIKRNFEGEIKIASAKQQDSSSGDSYTLVIGKAEDHAQMKEMARKG